MINVEKIREIAAAEGNAQMGSISSSNTMSQWAESALASVGAACNVNDMVKRSNMPRQTWFGIPSTAAAQGTTVNIPLNMVQVFAGQELRVSESVSADNFAVTQLKIMTSEQMVNYPVACHVFSELSLNASVDMDPAKTGTPITFSVLNISVSGGNATFIGSFFGYTVQGC